MKECPPGLTAWLVEKRRLMMPPADAAYDYSLEPADAQLEPIETPPAATRLDIDEVYGRPLTRVAAASSAHR